MSTQLQIFTVKDGKADAFITPFFLPNKEMAIRTFGMSCSDEGHTFGCYPQDYHLYHLGSIDISTGLFDTKPPELMITGMDARNAFTRDYAIKQNDDLEVDLKSVS